MVAVTDPRLRETVLDAASGTGGFLVEAFNHLSKQVKTVADRKNPRAKEDITHLPPAQLAETILEKERRIAEILGNVKGLLARSK